MKWYDVKEKLPPTNTRVLVCFELRAKLLDHPIQTHEIGILEGTEPLDRWRLESQHYSPHPFSPTLSSGFITHWARLPKLPNKKD